MVSRALIGWLTFFLILVLPPILRSSGISGVDYWLPYDLARYAPDVIPLQCNGPNTTWDHEASPDSAVCYRTHESLQHWETICLIWWFSVAGDKHEHVAGGVHTPGETHLSCSSLPTFLISVHRNHCCSTGAVRPSSNPNKLWGRPNGLWHLPHPRWGQRVHL